MARYIGIDIGGTNIAFGLVNEVNECLRYTKIATESHKGSDYILATIAAQIMDLAEQADEPILAVGIGVPGFVDHTQGISLLATNLGWKGLPVVAILEELIQLPVYINNDVRLFAYGEALAGAGKNYKHVLGITLGTGIAASMVNEGKLYYGSGNRAGEIGHISMPGVTYICNCGLTGCLETAASANGIARQAKDAINQGQSSILQQWYPGDHLNRITASDVSKAYDLEDELAIKVMENTGELLGKGLAYAVNLYSPDVIVIGGGAAYAGERVLGPTRRQLKAAILPDYWNGLTLSLAHRIEDAGIIGAALYAQNQVY